MDIKHKGFGRWQVLDGDTVVAEDLTKREAQELAGLPVDPEPVEAPKPVSSGDGIPTHDASGRELSEFERRRLYEKRMESTAKADEDTFLAPYKALVQRDFPDAADRLWMKIEPILKAGGEGLRREVGRNMKGRNAA